MQTCLYLTCRPYGAQWYIFYRFVFNVFSTRTVKRRNILRLPHELFIISIPTRRYFRHDAYAETYLPVASLQFYTALSSKTNRGLG